MNYQDIMENRSSESLHPSQAHTLTENEQKKHVVEKFNGVNFEVYAYSKAGHNKNTNFDNFYCNKNYMKGFKYVDFKKSAQIYENNCIFAVCTGEGDEDEADEACKKTLAFLKEQESFILEIPTVIAVETRLKQFVSLCDRFLRELSAKNNCRYEVNLLIAIFVEDKIVYISLGDLLLMRYRNKKAVAINEQVPTLMGSGNPIELRALGRHTYYHNDTYFLCSKGIKNTVTVDRLGEVLKGSAVNVKELVIKVIETTIKCGVANSSTCLAVYVNKADKIKASTYIISALCGIITVIDLLIILTALL